MLLAQEPHFEKLRRKDVLYVVMPTGLQKGVLIQMNGSNAGDFRLLGVGGWGAALTCAGLSGAPLWIGFSQLLFLFLFQLASQWL